MRANKQTRRRNKTEKEFHYTKITELYFDGHSQASIAKVIGISASQVAKDLEAVRNRWVEETNIAIDVIKAEQLKKIDWMEKEYRECWEASKKRVKTVSIKRGGIANNTPTGKGQFEISEEEEIGDTRFLDGIKWCISERLKITGGYAPKKIAETDPTGTKSANANAREEILALIDDIGSKMRTSQQIAEASQPQNFLEAKKDYVDGILIEDAPEEEPVVSEEMSELIRAKIGSEYVEEQQPLDILGTSQEQIPNNKRHDSVLYNQSKRIKGEYDY